MRLFHSWTHPWRGLLLGRGEEAHPFYGLDHLLDGHGPLLIGHAGELLLETYFSTPDTFQPFQGLLDHDGAGPSRHAVNPQESYGGL